jgi:hypothetical protein
VYWGEYGLFFEGALNNAIIPLCEKICNLAFPGAFAPNGHPVLKYKGGNYYSVNPDFKT